MKILTYNSILESNLSYSHTMRQLLSQTQSVNGEKVEWLYGTYEQAFPFPVQRELCTYIPTRITDAPTYEQAIAQFKPDAVFMHDDPQRCNWLPNVKNIPTFYWLPWDNEDPRIQMHASLINKVSRCVMVAKFAQKFAQQIGCNVGQIYNPINTDIYHPDPKAGKDLREKLNIPQDHKLLLWVGRPGWRKRLMHVAAAAAQVIKKDPTVHLMLHMDVNDPGMGYRLQELLHALDIQGANKVIIPGDLNFQTGYPPEVLNAIYNASDLYIAAHGGEGAGLPLFESLSCGKPIIATDYTTTQEIAGYEQRGGDMIGTRGVGVKIAEVFEDKGIMRPYIDMKDYVSKIEMLLKKPDLCVEMGKAGRLFVQKEVDYRVVGAKWQEEFKNIQVNEMKLK